MADPTNPALTDADTDTEPTPARERGTRLSDYGILRALVPYLRPHVARISIALGCLVIAKLLLLGVPQVMKRIVDALDVAPDVRVLPIVLLAAYGAARVGNSLFTELRQVVFARVMARTAREVTLKVFRHLHALSLRFHLDRRTGGVARDVERGGTAITDLLDWTIYTIIPTALEIVLVTVILMVSYDWSFGLITLVTLAAYIAWTFAVTEWRTRYYRAMVEADTQANARSVDSLLNYETVKYFNNEAHEVERYDVNLRKVETATVKSLKTLAVLNVGQSVIVALGVSVLMWRAAAGVVAGELTLGDLVLVNAYLLQLSAPLNYLGMMYREIKQALTSLERLFGLLDEPLDVQDAPDAQVLHTQTAHVRFEDVRFGYDPRREILKGVDFEIRPGQTVAVVGHSGSGKSTLARLLYRFYDPDGGRITIDGHDLRALTQSSVRGAIATVPQDTVLFNDTIHYNILYGRPAALDAEVIDAARAAHIHASIERLPDGYASEVGERGLKLSGGEKQRVAIARALLKNPAILVFDEATSALDSKSEQAIQAELERISQGRTTLVIAHRLSTVMNAHEILVMDDGHIVERGTHATLLDRNGHYAQMWQLQQRGEDEAATL